MIPTWKNSWKLKGLLLLELKIPPIQELSLKPSKSMPEFAKKKSMKLDEKPMPVKQLEEDEIANLYKSLKNIRWNFLDAKLK